MALRSCTGCTATRSRASQQPRRRHGHPAVRAGQHAHGDVADELRRDPDRARRFDAAHAALDRRSPTGSARTRRVSDRVRHCWTSGDFSSPRETRHGPSRLSKVRIELVGRTTELAAWRRRTSRSRAPYGRLAPAARHSAPPIWRARLGTLAADQFEQRGSWTKSDAWEAAHQPTELLLGATSGVRRPTVSREPPRQRSWRLQVAIYVRLQAPYAHVTKNK